MNANKAVLVTGANSGLGYEASRQLAQAGWNVIIAARSKDKADAALARLSGQTNRAPEEFGTAVFDNNKPSTIRAAVAALASAGWSLDAVVLNAGGLPRMDADGSPGEERAWVVDDVHDERAWPRRTRAGAPRKGGPRRRGHRRLRGKRDLAWDPEDAYRIANAAAGIR